MEKCFDDAGAPIISEVAAIKIAANMGTIFVAVCRQCKSFACWECADRSDSPQCALCRGPLRGGYLSNTGWSIDMSPDLRDLLLDLAVVLKYDSHNIGVSGVGSLNIIMCEYTKWLSIAKHDPTKYTAPPLIKNVWNCHMINSRNYMASCRILHGAYIHAQHQLEPPAEDIIPMMRKIEPFTTHTAVMWKCTGQSPAHNFPPEGDIFIQSVEGTATQPFHPLYTEKDILIRANAPAGSLLVWEGRVIKEGMTLGSYGVAAGGTIVLILGPEQN
jgi:hypothetical protein